MKKPIFFILLSLFTAQAALPAGPAGRYENPVSPMNLPDPSLIRGGDGFFYLFATENRQGLPVMRSADLIEWERVASAFTSEGRPGFVEGAGIWAPSINRIGGKYVLYYSMSTWGGEEQAGIGAAWAEEPTGPYTDVGKLVDMANTGVKNSIDPFYVEEGGRHYLFWGSFSGLFGIELESDGLSVKPGASVEQIAGRAYEATYIHKKDGYYYLFASIGTCCEGVNSTYTTVVGRSADLFGPYTDRNGNLMLDNRYEIVIKGNDRFKGPGHNSEIITDDEGTDWILYHAVDVEIARGRQLMLDRVDWVDGWPVVGDGTPSLSSPAPVFH